jgi:LCP family protein required for cell wall assembly
LSRIFDFKKIRNDPPEKGFFGGSRGGLSMKNKKLLRRTGVAACALLAVIALSFAITALFVRAPEIGDRDSGKKQTGDSADSTERLGKAPVGYLRRFYSEGEDGLQISEGEEPETVSGNRRKGTYTILLIGTSDDYTSDTLMVGTIDTVNKSFHVLSIPRDTKVDARRYIKKINSALGTGGVSLVVKEVSEIVGFEPDFTVKVGLEGLIRLVDAIGGVDFDVPYRMNYDDPTQDLHIHFEPGLQHLDGQKAMELVRYRGHIGSDFSRMEIQQQFLMAVAKKLLTPKNITKIETFAKIYSENVETDLSVGNLIWLGLKLYDIGTDNIHMYTLPTYTKNPDVNPYYYQFVSSAETIELINETINPYETAITKKNVRHVQFVQPVKPTPSPSPQPDPTPQAEQVDPSPVPTHTPEPSPAEESHPSPTPTTPETGLDAGGVETDPLPNPSATPQEGSNEQGSEEGDEQSNVLLPNPVSTHEP